MLLARGRARRASLTARHELTADSSPARNCGIDPRSSRFALDTAGRVNFWFTLPPSAPVAARVTVSPGGVIGSAIHNRELRRDSSARVNRGSAGAACRLRRAGGGTDDHPGRGGGVASDGAAARRHAGRRDRALRRAAARRDSGAGRDRAGLSGPGSEELLPGVAAGAQRPHPVLHGRSRRAGIPLAARRLQLLRPHLPGLPALTRARELLPARRRRGTMRSMVEGARVPPPPPPARPP